ncbi:hypothetical protein ABW19_dt0202100 [Dactylella cylindrospora]|nr:hypothetical protein ABW19_dt0202100 [Dactylella cylindrospora]
MTSVPQIQVFSSEGKAGSELPLPDIFKSPIRSDIVQTVHAGVAKNKRQSYAVSVKAGHQTSAESWGTGRAVARIPRVSGGGTHRAGQAAFGNMCRSGRMFAPTKVWRRWHVKINLNQKRFATASAVAATASQPLVLSRGHRISHTPSIPLVIDSSSLPDLTKTRAAVALLKAVGAYSDVAKVSKSRKLRAGKGKLRGRRHRQRRGPLIIYDPATDGKALTKAFRNIPGVETSPVTALNLLQLAPGGHLGRFVIWSSDAFKALDAIYGTSTTPSSVKKDYTLPSAQVTNADIGRIINSSEIQKVVRAVKGGAKTKRAGGQKKNPLKNRQVLVRLNPYAKGYAAAKLGQEKFKDGKPERASTTFHEILDTA